MSLSRSAIVNTALAAMLIPSICQAQSDYRDTNVEALLAPLGAATNVSVYDPPDRSSQDYQRMIEKLRSASPEILRLLTTEVTNIGILEKGDPLSLRGDSAFRAYRLSEAFRIVGSNAAPLLSALTNEFLSGKSVYGAECGLLAVGSAAWPIFLQGLTNSDLRVKTASAAAMRLVKGTDAMLGFPYLRDFAKSRSAPLPLRLSSVQSIMLSTDPEVGIPVLLQIAETETNTMLRCVAMRGLKTPGRYRDEVVAFLHRASEDKERAVRLTADSVLQELTDPK